jgi:hypothetical protein
MTSAIYVDGDNLKAFIGSLIEEARLVGILTLLISSE